MEQNLVREKEELEINLWELFFVLWKKKLLVILGAAVLALAGYLGTKLLLTEYYSSSTEMYIMNQQNEDTITQSDLTSGTQLTTDYQYMITTRTVLERAISELNLNMTYQDLLSKVSVTNTTDRIIKITVTDNDPNTAQYLADTIRDSAGVHIGYVTNGLTNITVLEEANLPTAPSGPSAKRNTALAGIVGAVVAIIGVLLVFILDDTIKTPDDVEKYLGASVLGNIPLTEPERGRKKRKKSNRQKRGKK